MKRTIFFILISVFAVSGENPGVQLYKSEKFGQLSPDGNWGLMILTSKIKPKSETKFVENEIYSYVEDNLGPTNDSFVKLEMTPQINELLQRMDESSLSQGTLEESLKSELKIRCKELQLKRLMVVWKLNYQYRDPGFGNRLQSSSGGYAEMTAIIVDSEGTLLFSGKSMTNLVSAEGRGRKNSLRTLFEETVTRFFRLCRDR